MQRPRPEERPWVPAWAHRGWRRRRSPEEHWAGGPVQSEGGGPQRAIGVSRPAPHPYPNPTRPHPHPHPLPRRPHPLQPRRSGSRVPPPLPVVIVTAPGAQPRRRAPAGNEGRPPLWTPQPGMGAPCLEGHRPGPLHPFPTFPGRAPSPEMHPRPCHPGGHCAGSEVLGVLAFTPSLSLDQRRRGCPSQSYQDQTPHSGKALALHPGSIPRIA